MAVMTTLPKNWRWMPGMPLREPFDGADGDGPWLVFDAFQAEDGEWHLDLVDTLTGNLAYQPAKRCKPDIDHPATIGCIEHGLLPEVWGEATGRRVAIQVVHTHRIDPAAYRLAPAYAVQVMVWFDTWRGHWTSEKYASKGDALLACLEAAPC